MMRNGGLRKLFVHELKHKGEEKERHSEESEMCPGVWARGTHGGGLTVC